MWVGPSVGAGPVMRTVGVLISSGGQALQPDRKQEGRPENSRPPFSRLPIDLCLLSPGPVDSHLGGDSVPVAVELDGIQADCGGL